MKLTKKEKAPKNRTIEIPDSERAGLEGRISQAEGNLVLSEITDKTFNNDFFDIVKFLPQKSVELLVIDPPYNLDKDFSGYKFKKMSDEKYQEYLESWFPKVVGLLKENGSLYICGDWRSTCAIYKTVKKHLIVRNRIVWQREKGRGAKKNWKNCSEDIWFATVSDDYYFDVEAVKMKRRVVAPYRENGKPKDWEETEKGNFRLTCPSNFWDDITVPYWSMSENTDHPAQKPEKLLAKLVLASCPAGGLVFDPFLGSGTTSVVAKKLGRRYCGVEVNREYCLISEKRLLLVEKDKRIQGYNDGYFWERNTLNFLKGK
ncbi:site-specific DNA-methyltransferase [candidate division WOR-3 bacterium]|nr:site-specific DNA-methyltransferase [candidate division WOR-3 bacterium]